MSGTAHARGELASVRTLERGMWEDEWCKDVRDEFDGFLTPLQYFMMIFMSGIDLLTLISRTPAADIVCHIYTFSIDRKSAEKSTMASTVIESFLEQLQPDIADLKRLYARQIEGKCILPECKQGPVARMTRRSDGSFEVKFVFHRYVDMWIDGNETACSLVMYINTENVVSMVIVEKIGSIQETVALLWLTDLPDRIRPTPNLKTCTYCKRIVATGNRCPDCRVARYCCRKCQKEDWPAHKGQRCSELLAGKLAQLDVRDGDEPHAPRGEGGAGA